MTMAVQQHGRIDLRRLVPGDTVLEEFAEQEGLPAQPIGARVRRKQVAQLVPEYRCAARLEDDDGQSCVDSWAKLLHRVLEILLRFIEEAEVVERPAAAHVTTGNDHLDAGVTQHGERRPRRRRREVVVERVREQDDLSLTLGSVRDGAPTTSFGKRFYTVMGRPL